MCETVPKKIGAPGLNSWDTTALPTISALV